MTPEQKAKDLGIDLSKIDNDIARSKAIQLIGEEKYALTGLVDLIKLTAYRDEVLYYNKTKKTLFQIIDSEQNTTTRVELFIKIIQLEAARFEGALIAQKVRYGPICFTTIPVIPEFSNKVIYHALLLKGTPLPESVKSFKNYAEALNYS